MLDFSYVLLDFVPPANPVGPDLGRAVEHLVMTLPPKERACVLLKDVFDYTLDEIAELVDSTLGGVKAALNRGRAKLAVAAEDGPPPRAASEAMSQLLHLYVDRFNRRDWDGLRELISADARLQVADRFVGRLSESPYFGRYEKIADWRMALGEVDGRLAIVSLRADGDRWTPQSLVRLDVVDDRVVRVVDYLHCPWVLANARSVEFVGSTGVSPAAAAAVIQGRRRAMHTKDAITFALTVSNRAVLSVIDDMSARRRRFRRRTAAAIRCGCSATSR